MSSTTARGQSVHVTGTKAAAPFSPLLVALKEEVLLEKILTAVVMLMLLLFVVMVMMHYHLQIPVPTTDGGLDILFPPSFFVVYFVV